MKAALFLLSLLFALMTHEPLFAADAVGVRKLAVAAPHRGKDIAVTIWYPAGPGGEETRVGENKLFKGTPAFAGAPPLSGRRPLIFFSHGSGARIEQMGWLAASLAEAGFIVAGPNHPHTTSGDSTPYGSERRISRPS